MDAYQAFRLTKQGIDEINPFIIEAIQERIKSGYFYLNLYDIDYGEVYLDIEEKDIKWLERNGYYLSYSEDYDEFGDLERNLFVYWSDEYLN